MTLRMQTEILRTKQNLAKSCRGVSCRLEYQTESTDKVVTGLIVPAVHQPNAIGIFDLVCKSAHSLPLLCSVS